MRDRPGAAAVRPARRPHPAVRRLPRRQPPLRRDRLRAPRARGRRRSARSSSTTAWEGRLELLQRPHRSALRLARRAGPAARLRGDRRGGVRAAHRDRQLGASSPSRRSSAAHWRFQLGGRYEDQDVTARGRPERAADRAFDGLSGSLGAGLAAGGAASRSALSLARSTKLPNAEELFSNGPHLATNAFEIGDPDLEEETSLGARPHAAQAHGGRADRRGQPVRQPLRRLHLRAGSPARRRTACRSSASSSATPSSAAPSCPASSQLLHGEPHHVDLEFGADFVRAELRDTGEPLPRIPPQRYRLGVHYRGERLPGPDRGAAGRRAGPGGRLRDGRPTATPCSTPASAIASSPATMVYDLLLRGAPT